MLALRVGCSALPGVLGYLTRGHHPDPRKQWCFRGSFTLYLLNANRRRTPIGVAG